MRGGNRRLRRKILDLILKPAGLSERNSDVIMFTLGAGRAGQTSNSEKGTGGHFIGPLTKFY